MIEKKEKTKGGADKMRERVGAMERRGNLKKEEKLEKNDGD